MTRAALEDPRDLHAEDEASALAEFYYDFFYPRCLADEGASCPCADCFRAPPRHEPLRVPRALRALSDMDWHLEPDELAF